VILMRTTSRVVRPIVVEGSGAVGRLELPAGNRWRDVVIASSDVATDEIDIEIRSEDAASRFSSFSYWLLQPQ
jgi:hypothetical protein